MLNKFEASKFSSKSTPMGKLLKYRAETASDTGAAADNPE